MDKGKVMLVGAGAGNVELLTLGGLEAINHADVVVYDRLVGKSVLELIPPSAEMIPVGKRAAHHPVPQQEINKILLNKALEGKNVVRLKGGDCFLFGRGGEELDLLRAHNIQFKVIPGVTSAIAAPAYGGIPVTHRDYCSSVHIVAGHAKDNGKLTIDYKSLVNLKGTLVFLMSVGTLGEIANGLMENGMDSNMPAAVIERGTLPEQRKLISILSKIEVDAKEMGLQSPAIIMVGRVCELSDKYDWFSHLPLKGKKILVTRPKQTSKRLRDGLLSLGADVTAIPAIKTVAREFTLPDLNEYNQIIFTSAFGVECFFQKLFSKGLDTRTLGHLKFAVVGKETANKLLKYGIVADFIPEIFSGEALAKEMIAKGFVNTEDKLLLFRGKIASQEMNGILKNHGVPYHEVVVYDTVSMINEPINLDNYEIITFTSASCVMSIMNHIENKQSIEKIKAVCIGEQTAAEAKKHGFRTTISKKATITSMIETIKEIHND